MCISTSHMLYTMLTPQTLQDMLGGVWGRPHKTWALRATRKWNCPSNWQRVQSRLRQTTFSRSITFPRSLVGRDKKPGDLYRFNNSCPVSEQDHEDLPQQEGKACTVASLYKPDVPPPAAPLPIEDSGWFPVRIQKWWWVCSNLMGFTHYREQWCSQRIGVGRSHVYSQPHHPCLLTVGSYFGLMRMDRGTNDKNAILFLCLRQINMINMYRQFFMINCHLIHLNYIIVST